MGQQQSRAHRLIFQSKSWLLRAHRGVQNFRAPLCKWPSSEKYQNGKRFELRLPLYLDLREEERGYELGKIANLRAAVRHIDGILVPASGLFSFWKQVGRATPPRGFVRGRMLQSGCIVPSVGGGLCQLSNALYELALRTECEIVERHAHSHAIAGAPPNDATVAWNYIDLRFRPKSPLKIEAKLTSSDLVVAFICADVPEQVSLPLLPKKQSTSIESCATCDAVGCSRHETTRYLEQGDTAAFLVDGFWPEFDTYLQQIRSPKDALLAPIDGARWRLPQYAWTTSGFQQTAYAPAMLWRRSFQMRRVATQGEARQRALLSTSADMAKALERAIPFNATHLIIDQAFLLSLWQSGALGGRTFDVLMRRLPMRVIHDRLDAIATRWPESITAADFRADAATVRLEWEALAHAQKVITPHAEIAEFFGERAQLLNWKYPDAAKLRLQRDGLKPRVLFPGPVAARKGAYLLREAFRDVDAELICCGSSLENPIFTDGMAVQRELSPDESIAAIVQPTYLEERPRMLLQAMRDRIPVITTKASGLTSQANVHFFEMDNANMLRETLIRILAQSRPN